MRPWAELLILFFSLLLISCRGDENLKNYITEKIDLTLNGKKYEIPFSVPSPKRNKVERQWINMDMQYQFSIGGMTDTTLIQPVGIKTDTEGNIYILDAQACQVKVFNSSGGLIKTVGGKGNGPGEFISPWKFDVFPDGKIIVVDLNQRKYHIFDNESVHAVESKIMFTADIEAVSDSEFCLLQTWDVSANSPVMRSNFKEGKNLNYKNIFDISGFEDIPLGPLPMLQGELNYYNDGLAYVPHFINYFFLFSSNGNEVKAFRTIEDVPIPPVDFSNSKMFDFRIPKEYLSALGSSVVEDKLIIVPDIKENTLDKNVLDFYSLANGNYLFSTRMIELKSILEYYITEKNILIMTNNAKVDVYNYQLEKSNI